MTTAQQDRAEYDRIRAEMRTKEPLSPEYNALWQQSEDIKNRHLGYVPAETIAQEVQQVRQRMKQTFDPWTKE